jgi:3-keto-disaccharide hydrolase
MLYSQRSGPRHPVYSRGQMIVLSVVVSLIIISSGVLFYSAVTYQVATSTASAQAIASAIARATTLARENASATAIASTLRNPYPPYMGSIALYDPLANNDLGHSWDLASSGASGACQFVGKAYQSSNANPAKNLYSGTVCFAENTDFSDFTLQVQAVLEQGLCEGIVFRGNSKTNSFDRFVICANAWYDFRQCNGGYCDVVFANGLFSAINTKPGATNTLAVVASGTDITLYVNGKQMITASDNGFSEGQIGLVTSGYNSTRTVATFRDVEVWTS